MNAGTGDWLSSELHHLWVARKLQYLLCFPVLYILLISGCATSQTSAGLPTPPTVEPRLTTQPPQPRLPASTPNPQQSVQSESSQSAQAPSTTTQREPSLTPETAPSAKPDLQAATQSLPQPEETPPPRPTRALIPDTADGNDVDAADRESSGNPQEAFSGAAIDQIFDTGGGLDVAGILSAYPWPPEEPSSRIRIDLNLNSETRSALTLANIGNRILRSLQNATYSEASFYAAPGGFVVVTRLEAINPDGRPLPGTKRYELPSEKIGFDFKQYIRNLFFAPDGYYRFIAFAVSDVPYVATEKPLSEAQSISRLRRGASRLTRSYSDLPFTDNHQIDALIYEFEKQNNNKTIETLRPGRLSPRLHLNNSGLSVALAQFFDQ